MTQKDRFVLLDTQTEGESELKAEITELRGRIIVLEATIRYIAIEAGWVPKELEADAIDLYMTALQAKSEVGALLLEQGINQKSENSRTNIVSELSAKEGSQQ